MSVIVLGAAPLLMPGPVDPVAWAPDPRLTGDFAVNDRLAGVERLLAVVGVGPEDVACGADGTCYTGFQDGLIVPLEADGCYREFANTSGRPPGMHLDALLLANGGDSTRCLWSLSMPAIARYLR